MQKPLCRFCGHQHYTYELHILNKDLAKGKVKGGVSKVPPRAREEAKSNVTKPKTVKTAKNGNVALRPTKQERWRERHPEAHKEQRREYMRKYRAKHG